MTKGKYPNGLAALFKAQGKSQSALARHLDEKRQNVGRWVHGERKIPIDAAEKIAAFFGVTRSDVLFEDGSEITSVPLVSWVSAGSFIDTIASDEVVDAPRLAMPGLSEDGEWIALVVEGDSMDRISPPESVIFVDVTDKKLVPNACYIVGDDEGRFTYKRYRPDPDRFEPVSINSEHEAIYMQAETEPVVVGRVRKTVLDL